MKTIHDIDEVYVVNLPERSDRKELIDGELKKYGITYTLFEAVKNDNGIQGLLDSMKNLFRQAISKNQSNIMVLEDDAHFLAPPIDFLNAVIPQLPNNFWMLYMGVNFTDKPKRYSLNLWQVVRAYSSHAIIYSRAGIEYCLNILETIPATAYDIILMNNVQGHGHCYATHPVLATQRPGWSDIDKMWRDWGMLMTTTYNIHTMNMEDPQQRIQACFEAHYVGNIIPTEENIELDGKTCNCGKLKYVAEMCGCPDRPKHLVLKTYQNE